MKKIFMIAVVVILSLTGCSDFLETKSLTEKNTSNFPANEGDMYSSLIAAYSNQIALGQAQTSQDFFVISEILSDDRLGGGESDRALQGLNAFKKYTEDQFLAAWKNYYSGIFRANFLIESIDNIQWKNKADRDKILGRAYFIRAYYYFDLCRLFERVPLRLKTGTENIPQATPEELYGQMASDLKNAIELLPAIAYQTMSKSELGLATKWSAEALMGRMFMFYTGFYKKNEIALPEGGSVSKENTIAWLEDCINNSGHGLISEYRNLWSYAYCKYYGYTTTNNLKWIGETGDNIEAVYLRKYSALGNAGVAASYDNNVSLFLSHGKQHQVPFGYGNGIGTVNPKLWSDWPDNDIRKKGTVYYAYDPEEKAGSSGYKYTAQAYQETGYWSKKNTPINVYKNGVVTPKTTANMVNMSVELYGRAASYQQDNSVDLMIIRFSDVLLMASELGSANAQTYFDRVRARVGLLTLPVTLDNLKAERRWEFATEAIRYWDLMRWGDVETVINQNMKDIPIIQVGTNKNLTITFRPETRGFLWIPQSEINLSYGVLTQNPGWGPESLFTE